MTPDLRATVTTWLVDEMGLTPDELTPETPLFSSQRLDSIALIDLLELIEGHTGLSVRWHEVSLDNLDSIVRIEAWVAGRGD